MKHIAIALLIGGAHPAAAQPVHPWTETIISVDNIAASSRLFREIGGWQVTHKGKVDSTEIDYWNLPEGTKATFERLCAPKTTTGCIRFIRFAGVPQRPIRQAKRAWDTGGIFSIMVRSDNVPALFDAAIAMGWWAESEPIRFTFGASDLRNIVLTGPHGINLAVYQRVSPPFTAFPVGRISQAFNSMRMVRDKSASRRFYEEKLGFAVLFDSNIEPVEPAPSNFGIPLNFTPIIKRAAVALYPSPGETGRVEVMQLEGFTGLDVSAHASPPNLGIISVRYPVQNLASYRAALSGKGVGIVYETNIMKSDGLSDRRTAKMFSVRDPDGNLTDFYEATEATEGKPK